MNKKVHGRTIVGLEAFEENHPDVGQNLIMISKGMRDKATITVLSPNEDLWENMDK